VAAEAAVEMGIALRLGEREKWCLQLKRKTVGLSPVEEGRSDSCALQGDALGG
jgi:hypothetical protein